MLYLSTLKFDLYYLCTLETHFEFIFYTVVYITLYYNLRWQKDVFTTGLEIWCIISMFVIIILRVWWNFSLRVHAHYKNIKRINLYSISFFVMLFRNIYNLCIRNNFVCIINHPHLKFQLKLFCWSRCCP